MDNRFFTDQLILDKGTKLNNIIKVPVVFVKEIVKFYPELKQRLFMPYEEIKEAVKWHKEHGIRIPIAENHVPLINEKGDIIPVNDERLIGYISQLEAEDEQKHARGWAYITRSKVDDFVADALERGHIIGVSAGGFAGQLGPPGIYQGQAYDASQMKLRFHHAALITEGLPRCPPGQCGFNMSEAYPEKFSKAINFIIDKYSKLQGCVSKKIEFLYHEYRAKKKKINAAQIKAHAYSHCRKKLGMEDSYEISSETPSDAFKDFHETLILDGYLLQDACVNEFWDVYRGLVETLETAIINTLESKYNDNHLSNKNMGVNVSEDQIALVLKENEDLKAELTNYKNLKIQDAEAKINELTEANKEFADANKTLQEQVEALSAELIKFKNQEITSMAKTLIDSKKFTLDEVKAMDYSALKSTYDIVKRFSHQDSQVLRPKPANDYTTLPKPTPSQVIDSGQANELPPRQFRVGTPPPMDIIMDENNDHWKPRYDKTE